MQTIDDDLAQSKLYKIKPFKLDLDCLCKGPIICLISKRNTGAKWNIDAYLKQTQTENNSKVQSATIVLANNGLTMD